jgi:hypothetical protein
VTFASSGSTVFLGVVYGVQGTLTIVGRAAMRVVLVADQRLNGRDERPGNQQKVVVQYAHEIEQRVETRRHLPGFYAGDVDLRQPHTVAQFSLAPATSLPGRDQIAKDLDGKAI